MTGLSVKSLPHATRADTLDPLRDEVEAIIARHAARGIGRQTPVPGLRVVRVTAPVPPSAHLSRPSLCLCVRGARRFSFGDTVFRHEEDRYLLSTVERPMIVAIDDASPERPYSALTIDLDLDLARQVMAEIDFAGSVNTSEDIGPAFGAIDADLFDSVVRLVRLIERPDDVAFLAPLVQREILYRLLSGPNGRRLAQIVRLGAQGQRITRAIAWLRTHYAEKVRIEDLADLAGMGLSTFHRHFQHLTGMSPLQYQKQLRLHEARRLMLQDDADIGTAALQVGYESATQFIREYRRLFGAPPLRHIKAVRSSGGEQEVF